jgi:hypothetical protein
MDAFVHSSAVGIVAEGFLCLIICFSILIKVLFLHYDNKPEVRLPALHCGVIFQHLSSPLQRSLRFLPHLTAASHQPSLRLACPALSGEAVIGVPLLPDLNIVDLGLICTPDTLFVCVS